MKPGWWWGPAAALVLLGAAIAGWFWRRGPTVAVPEQVLRWSPGAQEAPADALRWGDLQFFSTPDPDVPVLHVAVVQRAGEHITLEACAAFHELVPVAGGVWAVGELSNEGPGPAIDLVFSDGQRITRRSVPKPTYLASYERFTVEGAQLAVELSVDDAVPVDPEWCWQLSPLPVSGGCTIGPGRVRLVSRTGGATWTMQR